MPSTSTPIHQNEIVIEELEVPMQPISTLTNSMLLEDAKPKDGRKVKKSTGRGRQTKKSLEICYYLYSNICLSIVK